MLAEVMIAIPALLAAGVSYVCYRAVSRSLPIQIGRDQAAIRATLQEVLDTQERHLAKLVTWREDMEGLLEAVESTLDRVETKRRSAAASASRVKSAENANGETTFDPTNRQHLIQRARDLGIADAL